MYAGCSRNLEDRFEATVDFTFHGIEYVVCMSADEETMYVQIEEKRTCEIWVNRFKRDYIESLTQKTGNSKKFNVFVKMMHSALTASSESVFLDILSPNDLELLKARKHQQQQSPVSQTKKQQTNNIGSAQELNHRKRYLILTYMVEYDKVHYPLPLVLEENPDSNMLAQTICRLRVENDLLRQNKSDSDMHSMLLALKQENEMLREKLRKQSAVVVVTASEQKRHSSSGYDDSQQLLDQIEWLQNQLESKEEDLQAICRQNAELRTTTSNLDGLQGKIQQIKQSERMMAQQQSRISQMEVEIDSVLQQLEDYQENDRRQKHRIAALEEELRGSMMYAAEEFTKSSRNTCVSVDDRKSTRSEEYAHGIATRTHETNKLSCSDLDSSGKAKTKSKSRSNLIRI